MSEQTTETNHVEQTPAALVRTSRSMSIIWIVPIVALLIGGWLTLKAWSERGPVITITFETAEGLEANKTKIRFKEVEIGEVTRLELSQDLTGVVVTAEMDPNAAPYMREKTQFWVVRARVAAGEVSGLGTLFSGAYIGCNPSTEGAESKEFRGLEKPPVVTAGVPGRHFVLVAEELGSLDVGSPVYYRGIKVGQVVDYGFDEQAESVNVRVFVNAPYHEKVRKNTRFWNASGIDLQLDTEGVRVDTQSLVSIMLGGVAFDLPRILEPVEQAEAERAFTLYGNREAVEERSYAVKRYYLMYFDQNVRGLLPGAPVEIRGIRIGEVVDVKLEVDIDEVTARVAVMVMIEPERIDTIINGGPSAPEVAKSAPPEEALQNVKRLVEKGLRAQLKNGNLLTGQLYVDFDFYPAAAPAQIAHMNGYEVLPTLPAPFEQIAQRVNNILKQIERMPLEEIGKDLRQVIRTFNETLKTFDQLAGGINEEALPEFTAALDEFQGTLEGIDQTFGSNSALNHNARNVLSELTATIRSLRTLIDYVERHPQSVIFGREEE